MAIFKPFFRALPHNLSAALCESFTLFRMQNLSQTALAKLPGSTNFLLHKYHRIY